MKVSEPAHSESSDLVIGDVYSTATGKEDINTPTLKCRMCGKIWQGKRRVHDLFQSHLVSSHFKHLWASEVSKKGAVGEYSCHMADCTYQTKKKQSMLIHLAGKHNQLKQKLAEENIPADVLTPIVLTPVDRAKMIEDRKESIDSPQVKLAVKLSPLKSTQVTSHFLTQLLSK